jgi:hypothetical protein
MTTDKRDKETEREAGKSSESRRMKKSWKRAIEQAKRTSVCRNHEKAGYESEHESADREELGRKGAPSLNSSLGAFD